MLLLSGLALSLGLSCRMSGLRRMLLLFLFLWHLFSFYFFFRFMRSSRIRSALLSDFSSFLLSFFPFGSFSAIIVILAVWVINPLAVFQRVGKDWSDLGAAAYPSWA
jgi:hypothetical protein